MLSLRIAYRFLKSNGTQSLLIACGMAVAVSIQVFVGLLINSLQDSLIDKTVRNMPQITITSNTRAITISGWSAIEDTVRRTNLVTAVSPTTAGSAITSGNDKKLPLVIKGVNLDDADRIYHFNRSVYSGNMSLGSRDALIGRELADELGLGVGDKFTVTTPGGTELLLTVSGLYDIGMASINRSWVITQMRTAQLLFDLPGRITSLEMSVSDVFAADRIAALIEKELGDEALKVDNWKDQNQELLSGLRAQSISSSIIQTVILISVVIAIASILALTVMQKSRQIGILKAMGITNFDAGMIFVYDGFLLGLAGSLLGIILGLIILYTFDTFAGSSGVYINIDFGFIIISWFIALAASTMAGLFPAYKSLHLNPIDVIREG